MKRPSATPQKPDSSSRNYSDSIGHDAQALVGLALVLRKTEGCSEQERKKIEASLKKLRKTTCLMIEELIPLILKRTKDERHRKALIDLMLIATHSDGESLQ